MSALVQRGRRELERARAAQQDLALRISCPWCEAAAGAPCTDTDGQRVRRALLPHDERLRAALPDTLLGVGLYWTLAEFARGGVVVGSGHAWWGITLTVRPSDTPDAPGPWMVRLRQAYALTVTGYGFTPAHAAADARTRLGCAVALYQQLRRHEAEAAASQPQPQPQPQPKEGDRHG